MSVRYLMGRVQRLLVLVVLGLSGAYLLIYLYRWEWNRAIISGLFFVAAEVALATSLVVRRLDALERAPAPREATPSTLDRLRATPAERPNPFAWLTAAGRQGPGVFVGVLHEG